MVKRSVSRVRRRHMSRRGALAVELMVLGPVVAVLSLAVLSLAATGSPQPELLWSALAVVGVYVLSRVAGDLSASR